MVVRSNLFFLIAQGHKRWYAPLSKILTHYTTDSSMQTAEHIRACMATALSLDTVQDFFYQVGHQTTYSRLRNKRTPLNKRSPWNIWQKQ